MVTDADVHVHSIMVIYIETGSIINTQYLNQLVFSHKTDVHLLMLIITKMRNTALVLLLAGFIKSELCS